MRDATRTRLIALARLALGIGGVVTLGLLVRKVGAAVLLAKLRVAAPWLPVILALEGGRIVADAGATRANFGENGRHIPVSVLLRTHLIGYSVNMIAPAGRAAAEATKVALLAPWTSYPQATAVALTNQGVTLFANALVSVPCALAAWSVGGGSTLFWLLVGHAVIVVGFAFTVRAATRAESLGQAVSKRFESVAEHADAFRFHARALPIFPVKAVGSMFAGRLIQATGLGVVMFAVGASSGPVRAFVAQGITMIALALGVLVPGQIGATEGAFAASAADLGMTAEAALAVALIAHVAQTFWLVAGSLAPMVWPARLPLNVAPEGSTTSRVAPSIPVE